MWNEGSKEAMWNYWNEAKSYVDVGKYLFLG